MHKKKYGKMTVNAWLNSELERSTPPVMILFGVLLCMAGILVRALSDSPYRALLELGIADIVPPVWLMTLLWTIAFFTLGCAGGFVLAYRTSGGCEVDKYKGCMFFVMLSVAELCWYPLFFSANLIFFSVLLCLLILCLSVAVTVLFYHVTKLAGMIILFHDLWLIYMLILNFAVLFRA